MVGQVLRFRVGLVVGTAVLACAALAAAAVPASAAQAAHTGAVVQSVAASCPEHAECALSGIQIQNQYNGDCLAGFENDNGGVQMQACNSAVGQQLWDGVPDNDQTGPIQNAYNGDCLTGFENDNGGVQMETCDTSAVGQQLWLNLGNDVLENAYNGDCLTGFENDNGGVQMETCDTSAVGQQLWSW